MLDSPNINLRYGLDYKLVKLREFYVFCFRFAAYHTPLRACGTQQHIVVSLSLRSLSNKMRPFKKCHKKPVSSNTEIEKGDEYSEDTSNLKEIHDGIPQGSVLGPTHYLLFISDLLATDNGKWTYLLITWQSLLLKNCIQSLAKQKLDNISFSLEKRHKALTQQFRKCYWILNRKSKLSLENKLLVNKGIMKPTLIYGTELWDTCQFKFRNAAEILVLRIITDVP
ncbi:hypothetical protein EVAR_78594_1 [Eumeta japonica]|uniref:Uncharacterized protein n=1 Tax=Eumeta variegata TaxID=151549 RepID=A0A4C1U7Y4_EUMVA|nr:hypothetical protein EVAR_78594_1 [Eumeta japonica]